MHDDTQPSLSVFHEKRKALWRRTFREPAPDRDKRGAARRTGSVEPLSALLGGVAHI